MDIRHCRRGVNCGSIAVLVSLGLIGLAAVRAAAAQADKATGVREAADLGGTWQATLDPENKGEREGWFQPNFAAEGWRQVHVPGSFANVAPEIDRYEGVGWFRRSFRVPSGFEGRHVVLHFEGVNYQCKVWVNGRLVGENPDAFLGFDFSLGPETRFGEADRDIDWQIGRLKAGFEGIIGPYVCGAVIWCWADHPWDKTWLKPPLSPYGVFSRDRTPRPSVEIAKQGFLERQRQFEASTK